MALDDVLRLSIEGTWNGATKMVNVFHYRPAVGNLTPSPDQLCELWDAQLTTGYLALLNQAFVLEKLVCVPAVGNGAGAELAINRNGSNANNSMAAQVAAIISWRTTKRGRSYRGRTYLPPCGEDVINGNFLSAYQDLVRDWAELAMTIETVGFSHYHLVIASYTLQDKTDVVSASVPVYPGTQRRRRPGAGS